MQVLLEKEKQDFKQEVESQTRDFINKQKQLNLKELWQFLYKKGFISINNSLFQDVLLTEAICKIEPGIGLFLLTQLSCIGIIKNHGKDNQKEKYLEKLLAGELIGCFSLTEPNAGSDVTMIETNAKKDGSSWILNGHKIWASNGSISDLIITFAQTKEYKDKTGITCFIIHSKSKEIEILKDTPKLGVKTTPSNEILIKNLKLDEDSQVGNLGDGIKIALSAITHSRIFCTAQAVGLLSGILAESVKHSTRRNQFGKSISDFQAIQWYLADMSKDLDAARLLLYKACWAKESSKEELNKFSSMAKYFSTNAAQKHSSNAVQIHGGTGLNEDSYVAKAYRDSKVLEIYEGTNEIQKLIIAKELSLS